MNLNNLVAVVTGGASGLGLSTVEQFVAAGAKVAVFDMNEDAGKAAEAAHPGKVIFQKVNVAVQVLTQHWLLLAPSTSQ
jgi:NAD(P)-dependent dehydrogenase (short-subunit alcohol dehydrogenase family)